jgi:zinc transport system ATP-binding protein
MDEANAPIQAADSPAVSIRDMGVTYGRYDILKGVSCDIPRLRQTVIIGPNGAGKSTLVLALLGEAPHSGTIRYWKPKPVFGYVPQRLDFDRHLPLTVAEFMALGRTTWPLWLAVPRRVHSRNLEYLEMVRAVNLFNRPLGSLSGGETQRVFLARALMESPDVLILDEPASGVDVYGEQLLCEILDSFKRDFTIVMVSHDLATARAHGDWIICLNRSVVGAGPPESVFRTDVISRAFGLHLDLPPLGGAGQAPCACGALEAGKGGGRAEAPSSQEGAPGPPSAKIPG